MLARNGDLEQSPSFNSYSVDGLAKTAARVIRELDELDSQTSAPNSSGSIDSVVDGDGGSFDDDFEFVSFSNAGDLAVLFDAQIGPVFPVFNHDILSEEDLKRSVRIPLEKLIVGDLDCDRDRDPAPSSSSSEADELEALPSETYCVWASKRAESEDGKCKKSKSTGSSSKRWKLIELLRRSSSDGKDSLALVTPSSRKDEIKVEIGDSSKQKTSCGEGNEKSKAKRMSGEKVVSAHELFYVRKRMLKEEGKKRSYLPYRKDLVGLWANVPPPFF